MAQARRNYGFLPDGPSLGSRLAIAIGVAALHVFVGWLFTLLPEGKKISGTQGGSAPVHVRVAPGPQTKKPSSQPEGQVLVAPPNEGVSGTRPRVPAQRKPKGAPVPELQPKKTTEPSHPQPETQPENEPQTSPQNAKEQEPLFGRKGSKLNRFLPGGNVQTQESQRQLGNNLGDKESNGAEQKGEKEDGFPTLQAKPTPRAKVVRTEHNDLAYRLELERRFAEAWGGTRTLPPDSQFQGRTGEVIVYNVIINRDGSLRRIINVTSLQHPDRDFSAVDDLVREFATTVFPMEPIPDRIPDNPFVHRWSIRYMGAHYSFF